MKIKNRILIGPVSALAAPEVFWSLYKKYNVSFWSYGKYSKYYKYLTKEIHIVTCPFKNLPETLRDLESVINQYKFDAVMPLDDSAIFICNKLQYPVNTKLIGQSDKCTDFLLNKTKQHMAADNAGLRVANFKEYTSPPKTIDLNFPIVIKPSNSIEIKNNAFFKSPTFLCKNNKHYQSILPNWPTGSNLIVQEYIQGIGTGIFGINFNLKLEAISSHERIRMQNPSGSGSSACKSIKTNLNLLPLIEKFLNTIGYNGLFMIEFIKDQFGNTWFVEINGRVWGSMALARRKNAEYPCWAIDRHFGEDFELPAFIPNNDIVCRHLGRELIHLVTVLRGPKGDTVTTWPSKTRTISTIFKSYQKQYWYNSNQNLIFWINDTFHTIINKIK